MDQIRAFAKVIWQQRFWVLSVLGLIIAVVCWKLAASALDAQFASRKTTIDGKFAAMTTLESKSVHPKWSLSNGCRPLHLRFGAFFLLREILNKSHRLFCRFRFLVRAQMR